MFFCYLIFKIVVQIHCESHSLRGLDDHVSFPAMIGSDYCIVVFFNVIFIYKKRFLVESVWSFTVSASAWE